MTFVQPGSQIIENPVGKGQVYKGKQLITEVAYELQVLQSPLNAGTQGKSIVTGKIRRLDQADILWSTELLTLHLQDERKLDFICVNYDPECNIASDTGFYK